MLKAETGVVGVVGVGAAAERAEAARGGPLWPVRLATDLAAGMA